MIIARLAAADLRSSWRVWAGLFVVCAVAAVAGSVPGVLIVGGLRTPGLQGVALLSISGTTAAFGLIAVLVVVSAVVRLTTALLERTYALWQLAGVTPRGVRATMLTETTVVAAVGAIVGAVTATAFVPALVSESLTGASGLRGVRIAGSWWEAIAVVCLTLVAAILGAVPGSRRAAAVSPLIVLRAAPERRKSIVVRVIVAGLLTALALAMLSGLPRSVADGAAPALLIGPLLVAAVAVLGRTVAGTVVRLWTALVPERTSVGFSLARASTRWSTSRSDTTLAALLIAVGLPTALIGGQRTAVTAMQGGAPGESSAGATALLLSGPILLAAIGAAATAAMTARDRAREGEQLRAVGASPGLPLLVAAFEGLIISVTGVLTAAATVGLAVVAEWVALVGTYPASRPVFPLGVLTFAGAACGGLIVVSALLPAVLNMRREAPALRG
ncbi:hypothetical protein [Curtobacterium sp. BH-2-1-1]|uniref:hypothetical protein n=1 Tax=Curtobacterium sp. BH-2-1-1 TaxID=1905847 RepID=UPI0012E99BF7|nr:hypothetical protein [Curtobacterium sp. BH-2-1-1]